MIGVFTYIIAFLFLGLSSFLIVALLIWNKKNIEHLENIQRIEQEKQKDLLHASINGQDRERQRIAENLHDDLGPLLSIVKHSLSLDMTPERLQTSREVIEKTIGTVRQISLSLSPSILIELGLNEGIKYIVRRFEECTTITILVKWDTTAEQSLDEHQSRQVYRIVQEGLNNVINHSKANHCWLEFKIVAGEACLIIKDDGIGFSYIKQKPQSLGLGLKSIMGRVSLLHGSIDISSPSGFRLQITFPINDKDSNS